MTRRTYSSPDAFRTALEERVKASARTLGHLDPNRQRQLLLADRLLARLGVEFGDALIAKGGIALELRLPEARATQDLDILVSGTSDDLLDRLQKAGGLDLDDWLSFLFSTEPAHLDAIEGDGVLYEGFRFRVIPQLGLTPYGSRFGLDVVFGRAPEGEVTETAGLSLLSFIGVQPGRYRLYPRELHVAEKLHAYTMPRPRPNSRVKDLPDIALLAKTGGFTAAALRQAIQHTFGARGTHAVPSELPLPPEFWTHTYAKMAQQNRLPWRTIEDALAAGRAFLNPPLAGINGEWDPSSWRWHNVP